MTRWRKSSALASFASVGWHVPRTFTADLVELLDRLKKDDGQ